MSIVPTDNNLQILAKSTHYASFMLSSCFKEPIVLQIVPAAALIGWCLQLKNCHVGCLVVKI